MPRKQKSLTDHFANATLPKKGRGRGLLPNIAGVGLLGWLLGKTVESPVTGEMTRLLADLEQALDLDPSEPTERVALAMAAQSGRRFVSSYHGNEELTERLGVVVECMTQPLAQLPDGWAATYNDLFIATHEICMGTKPQGVSNNGHK